jgi:sugar/nucleoside kinase (ribokinase family)
MAVIQTWGIMSRAFDVMVVGELNADLILRGEVVPEFGQVEKLIDDATLTIGSSSAIFACGAARLGLKVAFVGKIGSDTFGQFMLDSLASRGVDTSHIIVDSQIKTGLSVILSQPADRAILTYPGSISALRYDEVDWHVLDQARHLHMGSYFLLDALLPDVPKLFAQAKQQGLTVSLDTNYDPTEAWDSGLSETLRHVDILLPNETELLAVARQSDVSPALDTLSKTVPMVAVKRGAQGGTLRTGDTTLTAAAIPVNVVDTTGAGDSFNAGFVYGFLQGWKPEHSLRLACVCGALSTQGAGGTARQPTLAEAEPFLNTQ